MRTSVVVHIGYDTEIIVNDHITEISGKFSVIKMIEKSSGYDLSIFPDDRRDIVKLRDTLTEYLESTDEQG